MNRDATQSAFSNLLLSGTLVHIGNFDEVQKRCGINTNPNIVMVISIDRYPDLAEENPKQWKQEIGHELINQIDQTIGVSYLWNWVEEGVLALLIELDDVDSEIEFNKKIYRMAEEIQNSLDRVQISVSIGIGKKYSDPYLLYHSFEEARKSMSGRFFQGNKLIFHSDIKLVEENTLRALSTEDRIELLALVRIGDEEGVVKQLKSFLDKVANACRLNEDVFKTEVVDLIMLISRVVVESGVNATLIMSKNAQIIQELYHIIRYDKFEKKVCEYAYWLTIQIANSFINQMTPVIRKATKYIQENHQTSITLEEIAQYCCVSKYHFSHLFKKEMGTSVIDFLNRIRIEKSMFYLEMTDLSMQEIATRIGFQDSNYFSRIFKKYIKSSPSEYRATKYPHLNLLLEN
ncbi:AraC family transcriptional regulator [Bacillus sp. AFS077874]|uniref:helix-turn-helix domain-containing protein n=1 Tax=Bacillus sp. AFS077874 TaxID=2033513 RepID=UPI000BF9B4B0|nr:helix-turn-helix domain-containing protein [Bacillus sp. AFS077874]PFM80619.1 AraC family transcriptional regulator [Bacillus sp. AFS077874]